MHPVIEQKCSVCHQPGLPYIMQHLSASSHVCTANALSGDGQCHGSQLILSTTVCTLPATAKRLACFSMPPRETLCVLLAVPF